MQESLFLRYLRVDHEGKHGHGLSEKTIQSRVANCRTVERHEGNLDDFFDQDKLKDLLHRLHYTKAEQETHQPLRHKIPINGNWYTGSATLKAAVKLYRQFKAHSGGNQPKPPPTPQIKQSTTVVASKWPEWPLPGDADELQLARIVAQFARFLKPEIVKAVVKDNERQREEWSTNLEQLGIEPRAYLWPKSPCAFPGVRRYAGSTEIAIFRKRAKGSIENALALDDNDYPKHLWSFVLTGKKFQKRGPFGYALAHLGDHKHYGNRATNDFEVVKEVEQTELHGLYTAPTNTVYLPTSTIRPTDFSVRLRNLLIRRAEALYGSYCKLLPPGLSVPKNTSDDWSLDQFEWSELVGDSERVELFLSFRRETMKNLFEERTRIAGNK